MGKLSGIIGALVILFVGTVYGEVVSYNYSYYLPYFVEGGDNWTGVALQNPDNTDSADVSVIVYDQEGNPSEPDRRTLAPGGQDAYVVGAGMGKEGWIQVNSDHPLTGLCFFGTIGQNSHMADITLIPELSKTLHVPHVGQNYQWDTDIMICNPNPAETAVTLTFRDKNGNALSPKNYTLRANGSGRYSLAGLVGNTEYVNGSVEISANQGVAAFALYTDLKYNEGMSFAGISAVIPEPETGEDTHTYYLPYFIEGSDNWTGVAFRNSGLSQNADISVTVYDQNGNIMDSAFKTLPSKGQDAYVVGAGTGKEGWIQIDSDQPLTGLCFFGTTGQKSHMADITLIPELSESLYVPHVGQNYQWDTDIMVCNPNPAETAVTLTFRDKDGNALSPRTYTLPARGSGKYSLSDLVGNSEYVNGSVEISANQGVAAFALYTDLKWNNGNSFAGISALQADSGKIKWYKDADGDKYSDGTSIGSDIRPSASYFPASELIAVSGDADDNNADVFGMSDSYFSPVGAERKSLTFEQAFTADGQIQLNDLNAVYSLSIEDADIQLYNDSSLARVVLIDDAGNEYLVYEVYSLLAPQKSFSVTDSCEESCVLSSVKPSLLKIEVTDAALTLHKIAVGEAVPGGVENVAGSNVSLKAVQEAEKIRILNEQIAAQGLKWIAGETSISKLSYAEKRVLFPMSEKMPNLQGFEYYIGGIFEIRYENNPSPAAGNSSLPDTWDWRSWHGANKPDSPYYDGDTGGSGWITSVKNQGNCGSCWAFAATGATEALVNLYFNQHLDLDLSEQNAVSCIGNGGCNGEDPGITLDYFTDIGVVNESCFPYAGIDAHGCIYATCGFTPQLCSNKCSSPSQLIKINGRVDFDYPKTDQKLKQFIFDYGPLSGGIYSWGHAMALVGYSKDSDGRMVWIFKNSWGSGYGEEGYARVKLDINDVGWTHALLNPVISSMSYEIKCYDKDGDGYYNWGISVSKPSSCPAGIPDEKDLDDSDPNVHPSPSTTTTTSTTTSTTSTTVQPTTTSTTSTTTSSTSTTTTTTLPQVVLFPDPNLEAAIRAGINKPSGNILISDLQSLTSLTYDGYNMADEQKIKNLEGIKYCSNLARLSLNSNEISDVSPLAEMINLTDLDLNYNQISNVSVLTNLANLRKLNLDGNQISNISALANLTNLTELRLDQNQISNINALATLTNITSLRLNVNQISNISALANLTNLRELWLIFNQISDIKPLVDNSGINSGDSVYLLYKNHYGNSLSTNSCTVYIPQLQSRGVMVDNCQ